ncbi:PREDICTED: chymotrypsin-1-like [Ceratosolen solmsi marchali]|uniref:Chymotrypsin-1-like n=1 Tax=Ceratosolen solmsi marchali TaxID=326594 RepID=A0AAJ7E0F0_9HYME|nr:PREDICTED: chymotrypsin-1-like [Ceratosolen solmsi marchali]
MSFRIVICLYLALTVEAVTGKNIRLVGGTETSIRHHSYMAAFKYISSDEHICGGAIISAQHVLTAGQCVDEDLVNINDLIIRVGTSNITESNLYVDGILFEIEQIFLHPDYISQLTTTSKYQSDIAVVKIRTSFEFSYLINRIELPTSDLNYGSIAYIIGWGKRSIDDFSPNKLRKTWMMIINNDVCESAYHMRILYDQFCAFQTQRVGACIGDVGSPLVANHILIGIVSLFDPCALGFPDIYVNIYSHIEYIFAILNL